MLSQSFTGKLIKMCWGEGMETGDKGNNRKRKGGLIKRGE